MRRRAPLLAVLLVALWGAAAEAREPNVLPEDFSRAVEAAIAGLAADADGPVVEECRAFLLTHYDASAEPLKQAKLRTKGIQLVRIVSILQTMENERRQHKEAEDRRLRNLLLDEPTLRFLLGLAWLVATLVVARLVRNHWVPVLEGYVQSHRVHVDQKTLLGIERLVEGIIILAGVNTGVTLFVMQGLPAETKAYYNGIRSQAFGGLLFLACGYGLLKVIDVVFDTLGRRVSSEEDERLVPYLRHGVKGILAVATVLVVLENLSIGVGSLLIVMGVAGLAMALAARETLANLFALVPILVERPFQVGDHVVVEGLDGYVEATGLMGFRLRTQEGTLAVIPNAVAARGVVNNLSRRPHTRRAFSMFMDLAAPRERIERAVEVVKGVLEKDAEIQDSWVFPVGATPRGHEIRVDLWCRGSDTRRALERVGQVHLALKRRFDEEGLTPLLARDAG